MTIEMNMAGLMLCHDLLQIGYVRSDMRQLLQGLLQGQKQEAIVQIIFGSETTQC